MPKQSGSPGILQNWSDNGDTTHTVTVTGNQTLTAFTDHNTGWNQLNSGNTLEAMTF
jgi:hypothetical protein